MSDFHIEIVNYTVLVMIITFPVVLWFGNPDFDAWFIITFMGLLLAPIVFEKKDSKKKEE